MPRRAAIALLCCCTALPGFAQSAGQTSATTKASAKKKPVKKPKKKARAPRVRHYAPPRVSVKVRAASLQKVALQLDERPDPVIDRPGTLVPFFERLYRLSTGDSPTLHIVHFGDSHTASDDLDRRASRSLPEPLRQRRRGLLDGGNPFKAIAASTCAAAPAKAGNPPVCAPAKATACSDWAASVFPPNAPAKPSTWMPTAPRSSSTICSSPAAAAWLFPITAQTVNETSTEGPFAPGFLEYATAPGHHRFEVRTLEPAPVRLFGWVTENPKGITYESMGINGAEAGLIQRWDEPMHAAYFKRRDPALIVLAYGTNEASDSKWTEAGYLEVILRDPAAAAARGAGGLHSGVGASRPVHAREGPLAPLTKAWTASWPRNRKLAARIAALIGTRVRAWAPKAPW
jgi:hypothetical protein